VQADGDDRGYEEESLRNKKNRRLQMSEKYLNRADAPFSDKTWEIIDQTVIAAAKSQLSGRKLLHTQGPYGIGMKTLPTGDKKIEGSGGAKMMAPCMTPLTIVYSEFSLAVRDIAGFEQSCLPIDLSGAARAAMECARQEDNIIFNGSQTIGFKGLMNIDGNSPFKIKPWDSAGAAADDIINAVTMMDRFGFHGPYSLALSADLYNNLLRLYPQGVQTEIEHIRQIVTDGIIKTSAIGSGGILISSGEQFANIVLGQDMMSSFIGPAAGEYQLMVSESIAINILEPKAVCVLQK
jgi:uncharacterized linocin/CFP29 family protein